MLLFVMMITIAQSQAADQVKPPKKGFNYSGLRKQTRKHNAKQMYTFKHTNGHVCSGHRYRKHRN